MLKCERISVMNLENAMRGARNPMNSWHLSDSYYDENHTYILGEKDLALASRLVNAGTSDHRKFIRQIMVSVDITAPIYWWKEFDTYKVGTVANSTSTMHKLCSKPFELEDFSTDHMRETAKNRLINFIADMEVVRSEYVETQEKAAWYDLIQMLPSSYNQMRTVTLNYEVLANIYRSRRNHKLDEWHVFCDMIRELPYFDIMIKPISTQK